MTRYVLALALVCLPLSALAQGADYDQRVFTGATSDALDAEVCTTNVAAAGRKLGTTEYLAGAKLLTVENRGAGVCYLSFDDPVSVVSTDANPGFKFAVDGSRDFILNGTTFGPRANAICTDVQSSPNCMIFHWFK